MLSGGSTTKMQHERGTVKPFQAHVATNGSNGDSSRSIRPSLDHPKHKTAKAGTQTKSQGAGRKARGGSSSKESATRPYRESTSSPGCFSFYYWTWRGGRRPRPLSLSLCVAIVSLNLFVCLLISVLGLLAAEWALFLDGSRFRDFQAASRADSACKDLLDSPGVYEFALVHPRSPKKRFKVYAGYSRNLRTRHYRHYRQHGSHLIGQLEASLKAGYLVMRRVKYCKTAEEAKALESRLLQKFDYPWNRMENGAKRDIALVRNTCCFCLPLGVSAKVLDARPNNYV